MCVSIPHKKYYFHRKNGITLLIINRQITFLHFIKTKKKTKNKCDNTFVHKQINQPGKSLCPKQW